MEQLYLRAAQAQADALHSTLGPQHHKGDDAPPRKMLRTLKRMASASITCFETHKQLSSYQTLVTKKLSLKAYTKQDIQEIRRLCETIVYIIQRVTHHYPIPTTLNHTYRVPHDRGAYTTALRLLSSIATAPDPIAFILLERHIHPILCNTLETSTQLPQPGSTALALLLDHVSIRQHLSIARHTLFDLAGREIINESQMDAAEKACSDLIDLADDSHAEIWVRMMVKDLLALVAKHPKLGFVLLEEHIYARVYRMANDQTDGASPGKLSRRLERLAAEGSSEMAGVRREIVPFLTKGSLTPEEARKCRELLATLLAWVVGKGKLQLSPPIALLEDVARSNSPAAKLLIEEEFYSGIEESWARGFTAIDTLYRLVEGLLAACLDTARVAINTAARLPTIPTELTDQLVDTMYDLLIICRNHEVYDESTVESAVGILLLAATSSNGLSHLIMDPNLIGLYSDIWGDASSAPRSPQVKQLLAIIRHNQAQVDLQNADTLISRLKHTREWSGLDSDNVKPLVQTLLSCATDSNLRPLHPIAINALLDLAKSPADCAAALLLPEFAASLKEVTVNMPIKEQEVSASSMALAIAVTALRVQMQLRDDLPRLLELSELPTIASSKVTQELTGHVRRLVGLHRDEAASNNEVLMETVFKGLLILATGRAPGRDLLSTAGGYDLLSNDALAPVHAHQSGYQNALHELMYDLEGTIDGLMQLSELGNEEELRLQSIAHRLVQICRKDLASWATTRAIELLGSLAKRPEAEFMASLRAEEISGPLRLLAKREGGAARLAQPIGRIMRSLGLE